MNKLSYIFLLLVSFNASADQYLFRDNECKTLGTILSSTPKSKDGSPNEINCITSYKEAICNYKSIETGKSVSQPTKYYITAIGPFNIWENNEDDNVKMIINETTGEYISSVTGLYLDRDLVISKQCSGKIIQHTQN